MYQLRSRAHKGSAEYASKLPINPHERTLPKLLVKFDASLLDLPWSRTWKLVLRPTSRSSNAKLFSLASYAWQCVPKFCVPAQERMDVRVVAHGGGVALSGELRDRLATERLSRSAELDVDMMLDRWRFFVLPG